MISSFFILFSFAAFAVYVSCGRLKVPSLGVLIFLAEITLAVLSLGAFKMLSQGGLFAIAAFLLALLGVDIFLKRPEFKITKPTFTAKGIFQFCLLVSLIGVVSYYARITPVVDIDSLGYHLPILYNLIKTHGIWDVFYAGFVGPNTYFPANHEVMQSFFTLITGGIRYNYLATLLGFLAFLQSVQLLYEKRKDALFSLLALLSIASTPFLFNQFLFFQIDLFLCCLLGSALAFLLASLIHKNPKYLIGFFLAFSLALGTKFNALIQGVLFFPFFLGAFFYFRKDWKTYLPAIIISIPLGCLWYVRNFINTGNPFFPFSILGFEGHSKFLAEMQGTSILDALKTQASPEVVQQITSNPDFSSYLGWPPLFLLTVCAFVAFLVFFQGFFKSKTATRPTLFYLLLLALILLLVAEVVAYLSSPYTFTLWDETIRYAAPIFALLPLLIMLLSVGSRWLRAAFYVLCTLILSLNLTHSFWLNPDYVALAKGMISKEEFLTQKLSGYRPLAAAIETLKTKPTAPIALAGVTFYGLLEQEGFEPYYINVDGCEHCHYPNYRNQKDSVRSFPDEGAWKELLQKKGIRYLMVGFNNYHNADRELYEKEWADKDPQMFEKLLESEGIALYKIHS